MLVTPPLVGFVRSFNSRFPDEDPKSHSKILVKGSTVKVHPPSREEGEDKRWISKMQLH